MPRRRGQPGGVVGKALSRLEEATGQATISAERLDLLEAVEADYRLMWRTLEDVGWTAFDYVGGRPQELSAPTRARIVQRARYTWMNDPQAGAAVELMNDFVFGRGVPPPRCKDKLVQEIVDEAWNDPDNQRVLTSFDAQMALGTDLALQSNIYVLFFMEGEDGKVKLSILRHDDVQGYVPHPDKRHRVLYYLAFTRKQEWDYKLDQFKPIDVTATVKPTYYEDIDGVRVSREEGDEPEDKPDPDRVGDGLVYHVRINRYSEQQMGTPRFLRTLRWYTAYNDFVKARLDMAQAAASIIMKRKVKGPPATVARDAAKQLSRGSILAGGLSGNDLGAPQMPMRPGSIIEENEAASHESLKLDSGSGNAQQDAVQIRAPISAAERFPQSYFGDPSNSNLATATSLELPVLKAVEARSEVVEGLFRKFIDTVIENAVEKGRIPPELAPEELGDDETIPLDREVPQQQAALIREAWVAEVAQGRTILDVGRVVLDRKVGWVIVSRDVLGETYYRVVDEAYEDQGEDEASTLRDLSYEFSMPSPLRRMMTDLVTAIQIFATTFDPNNTNTELSRALLTIAFGEALEVQDPADIVDRIFPAGYQDPAIAAAQAQMGAGAGPAPGQAPPNGDTQMPTGPDGKPAGAPGNSTRPEDMRSGAYNAQEGVFTSRNRQGDLVEWRLRPEIAEHLRLIPETERTRAVASQGQLGDLFRDEVLSRALETLDAEDGLLAIAAGERRNGS